MTNLGVVFLPQFPPERLRSVAAAADEAGVDELWLWEDCFLEGGIATAAAALAWTQHVRVGVGLLPVPLRNVALTAMEVATLLRMFPDRVRVGVGHGVQDWMAQVGARAGSPMTLLREYLTALRSLLHGERVSADGRYIRLDAVALDWPPPDPPEILVGATGPRTLRLAGELADGTILTASTTEDGVREARRLVAEGNASSGHRIIVYVAATSRDVRAVADTVGRFADAGAHTVVLQPMPDEPDPEGFVRFVGRDVRPRVV